jgi:TetR/AcrR family transcriptional regulator, transcriptional repressor for nem operon
MAPPTKGERTRQLLLTACKEAISEIGFHATKISDICERASVSAGTFYIYFKDKNEIGALVVEESIRENVSFVLSAPKGPTPYDTILAANKRYVEAFARFGPLNRAINQIVDSIPAVREAWMSGNHTIAMAVTKSVVRRPQGHQDGLRPEFAAMAAQAMLDGVLIQYFAWNDRLLRQTCPGTEILAAQLSVAWYRLIYGTSPGQVSMSNT